MTADRSSADARDAAVITAASGSRVVRTVERIADFMSRAYLSSRLNHELSTRATQWRAVPAGERYRLAGLVLIVAPAVHVALQGAQRQPPGWRWLVVPGIVAAQGVLLLVMSSKRG